MLAIFLGLWAHTASRQPSEISHWLAALASYVSAEGMGAEAHQSEVSCASLGRLLALVEHSFLPVQWGQAWGHLSGWLGPREASLRPGLT